MSFADLWEEAHYGAAVAVAAARYVLVASPNTVAVNSSADLMRHLLFALLGVFLTALAFTSYRARQSAKKNSDFEKVIEGLDEMITVVDREYRYVTVNAAFLKRRGAKKEDVIGRTIFDLMNPESVELVKNKIDECFEGKIVQFEMRYRYPVWGERDLVVSSFPINGAARVERVACVRKDITEKKQSAQSLRLFRALVDQSNDAVEVMDAETLQFLDVNERTCEVLGYTRDEILSMSVFDILPEAAAIRQTVMKRLRESRRTLLQTVHRRKDGSVFPVECSLSLIEMGRSYIVAVSRDLTERKHAEQALLDSEGRYRDLVEHSEDLLCTHDLEGKLLTVNPAPARILGYSVDEMLKIPMRDMIVPEGRPSFDEYLQRLRTTGEPEKGLLCVLSKHGEMRTWEFFNTLRTEGVEKPVVRGMAHDVTEQRRAELALGVSELRYRTLFEKTVAGVAIISAAGALMDCNDAWARMFGYKSAAECRGIDVLRHYYDTADRDALLDELKRSGTITDWELHVRRLDGSDFWLLLNDVWIPESEGGGLIQATVVDITARKHAEEGYAARRGAISCCLEEFSGHCVQSGPELRYTWIYNPDLYWKDDAIGKTDEEIIGTKQAAPLNALKTECPRDREGAAGRSGYSSSGKEICNRFDD